MTKDEISARIELLKKQNDEDNTKLINLNQIRESVIQGMLVRNGRILELEEILRNIENAPAGETWCGTPARKMRK